MNDADPPIKLRILLNECEQSLTNHCTLTITIQKRNNYLRIQLKFNISISLQEFCLSLSPPSLVSPVPNRLTVSNIKFRTKMEIY